MKKEAEILLRDAELDVGSPGSRQARSKTLLVRYVRRRDYGFGHRFSIRCFLERVNTMATWSPFNITRKFMKFE